MIDKGKEPNKVSLMLLIFMAGLIAGYLMPKSGSHATNSPNTEQKKEIILPGDIDNEQLKQLIKFEDITIIDIRRKEEWADTGVIEGSKMITLYNADGSMHKDFDRKFNAIVKSQEKSFVLVCRTGNRTGFASKALSKDFGYKNVYNLKNGITNWISSGNSVVSVPK